MKYLKNLICFFTLFFALGCNQKDKPLKVSSLFTLMKGDETGISFINEVKETEEFNVMSYRNYYNGGGVSIGDINNDGLADIYFTANMTENKLYLNKGEWQFVDITKSAGVGGTKMWSTGVTMADVNADGLLDIYVCNSGDVKGDNKENELFINNGDLTFTERAKEFGLNNTAYSTHATFFDYDLDGDLDCYLLNNSFKSVERVDQFTASRELRVEDGDKLLRNDNGYFTDVTESAGIYSAWVGFGLGVSVSDINGDLFPDIYISNDFWERDYLYMNNGDGTFSEELIHRTSVVSGSSMGSDVADLNNDGNLDIFTTEMLPADNYRLKTMTRFEETNVKELKVRSSYHYQLLQNCLHYNDGKGNFQELSFLANVGSTDWSWGALMFDMNNDGWKDIFVSNGIYKDITSMDFIDFVADRDNIKEIVLEKGKFDYFDLISLVPSTALPNYAFVNQGGKTFKNESESLGLSEPSFSNGAAYGDLDNDGDMDLVVNNVNMPCFVYRNNQEQLSTNNYLKVKFKGPKGNSFGIGASVKTYQKGMQQVLQNIPTRGFESSVEPQLLFGLGKSTILDSLVVVWPDRHKQVIEGVKSNQTIVLDHSSANLLFNLEEKEGIALFKDVTNNILNGNFSHRENDFNDFDVERLLPRKVSTEGPRILKADVNGDKLEDFLLLGAFGDPDKLFFQQKNGTFQEQRQDFAVDSVYESTCGVFFDPDNDGDLDLLIGSGGNEFTRGVGVHRVRFYENDGKGNLKKVMEKAPLAIGNFSCILAEDFDQDGDEDIFIGGRIVPGNYGLVPRSFLFRNDNGVWTNVTPMTLAGAGMVTGAVWSDCNNDSIKDLVVVGEWMPVKIFQNKKDRLEEAYIIPESEGWWTSIEKADLNNDGKEDFVLGNWGLNTKFKASTENPLTMYVKDFDSNGKSEFIINWYTPTDNKAYPFAAKVDITGQLPSLKKKILKYEDYAHMTYEDLFTEEQRRGAIEYKATFLQSAILWSEGNYKFTLEALPLEAQVAPVFAIVIEDLNGDNQKDLFLAGNFYGLKPEVGRHDSGRGVILTGDGNGRFNFVPSDQVGISIQGEVRDAKVLYVPGKGKTILIGRNDASAIVLQKRQP